eukprot:16441956-Heterocapsa_arctica.AAC.1
MKCFKDRATQISAAELLALLCALKCCRRALEHPPAIFFIDNNYAWHMRIGNGLLQGGEPGERGHRHACGTHVAQMLGL